MTRECAHPTAPITQLGCGQRSVNSLSELADRPSVTTHESATHLRLEAIPSGHERGVPATSRYEGLTAKRKRRSFLPKAIAHAAHGLDEVVLFAELAAQRLDVHVDGALQHHRPFAYCHIH